MREQGSTTSTPQARQNHPDVWPRDLDAHQTAFHLRTRGHPVPDLDDEELKQVPLLPQGTRLQRGATYVNLADEEPYEFTVRGYVTAGAGDAFAPKDEVPYEIWNRLIGESRTAQERR